MKVYNKHDYIQDRDLLPRERLEPQRRTISFMRELLNGLENTLNNASDALSEDDLNTIADAVQNAYNAVENAAFLGETGFYPRPVRAVRWEGAAEEDAPNILISVSGGMVQGVSCNIPGATCRVYDEDTEEFTDEDEEELERLCSRYDYEGIY